MGVGVGAGLCAMLMRGYESTQWKGKRWMNGDERLSRCFGSCPVRRLFDVVVVPSHFSETNERRSAQRPI